MEEAKKKLYIAVSVFVAITILTASLLWFFGMGQLAHSKQEHISAKLALNEIEQKNSLRQDLLIDFSKVDKGKSAIEASLLDPAHTAEFIENLESIASSTKITLSLQVAETARPILSASEVRITTFQVELRGSFLDAISFLRKVDSLPLLTSFNDISMRSISSGEIISAITLRVFTK